MEEIKSKRFDESDVSPWTSSAEFGAQRTDESDETGRDKYDDIDDFHGFSDTLASYSRNVTIDYVTLDATDTWQTCGSTSCTTETDCTICEACCYKRITVSVSRSDLVSNVSLVTVVAAY
jgi:hypothetical protein